ncbi:response regulator [Brevundimonas nasdae]|uniref:Response regulator n=1 Tax=Brevundimonas nasdae TaxID=172043 RepID=A0ABX8TKY4_9CAUL|nr:response regulator [Brevundimonas nasdae]QYC11896.1 response regulator [Brevundimonas nasdae]QYC14681.1 response regulator [Brevundimonas nasdae]
MFDKIDPTHHDGDVRSEAIRGIDRLCEIFDPLLQDPSHNLFADQKTELAALARIFDLTTNREPAEVWSDLRTMLVPKQTSEPADAGDARTIMVVEDDPDIAVGIMSALVEAGHRLVGPFESADAAEVSAALHQVDVALVDINLSSEANGIDLARALKSRWGVPTILMSGDITALSALGDLADAVMLKPFSAQALRVAIQTVAGPPKATAASAE